MMFTIAAPSAVVKFLILPILLLPSLFCEARDRIGSRHSFSLSHFDTFGKLRQVENAVTAAGLGPPVVAIITLDSSVCFVSPQKLPSVLMDEDGTPRFVRITSQIVLTHSGLSADGRALGAAAQRLAVEYEFTFDEEIPIENFLEEMSLLLQEYTLKPGCRPFGCSLMIAYLSSSPDDPTQLYRLDPFGSVTQLGSYGAIGNADKKLLGKVKSLSEEKEKDGKRLGRKLRSIIEESMESPPLSPKEENEEEDDDDYVEAPLVFLTAQVRANGKLSVEKHARRAK